MRFGIATCEITPPFPTTMGGYAARHDVFERVNDPLLFSAVIIEQDGRRALLGMADLCNWPNDGRTDRLIDRLSQSLNIAPSQIMLNASHTHGGPKIPGTGFGGRHYGDPTTAERYADWLADRVVSTADRANTSLEPGSLSIVNGRTSLPRNRRLQRGDAIVNAPCPAGPVDDAMNLLVLRDTAGAIRAIAMRLSCHPVATGIQLAITADFVGAWRTAFREAFGPEVTPLFLQGAAGDMRPRHAAAGETWRHLAHAELLPIGRELLAEMQDTLARGPWRTMEELLLLGHRQRVDIECEPTYTTVTSLEPLLESAHRDRRRFARTCLEMLERNEAIPTVMPILAQTLWLDPESALVGINAEPLVGLGAAIERAFAPRQALVMGYTNGSVGYAPDSVELARGGYEAESYLYEPLSGPWRKGFEHAIIPSLMVSPLQIGTA